MRSRIVVAACTALLPTIVSAQGWELRAGLEQASATVCADAGACFGIACSATQGWDPVWTAVLVPQGDSAVPDPILAIRMDGARFALTSLTADGAAGNYTAPVTAEDEALLTALQNGVSVSVDPGRDFALAEFSLRGSRWAMSEALDLCQSGGPEVFTPADSE